MSKLDDLIERLEKATGPSTELDSAITCFMFPDQHWPLLLAYTSSIDTALTLVPDRHDWWIGTKSQGGLRHVSISGPVQFGNVCTIEHADHCCPALALCIAALKARKAGEERG